MEVRGPKGEPRYGEGVGRGGRRGFRREDKETGGGDTRRKITFLQRIFPETNLFLARISLTMLLFLEL